MNTKMTSAIEKLTLDAATFHGVEVDPTFINFFYGNNGTGKSTIAEAIQDKEGVTWQTGKSADAYKIIVYNQDFVDKNLSDYGKLKGVFTVGAENIKAQTDIAEKTAQRAEQDKQNSENVTAREALKTTLTERYNEFQKICWEKTKRIREDFPDTQEGYKRPIAKFVDHVLKLSSAKQHDIGELRTLYETAFDKDAEPYSEFRKIGSTTRLKGLRGNELLAKVISSSGDTPYAVFVNAIKSFDWIQQGHSRFAEAAGDKCPYCAQTLPVNFEEQLASCVDEQYKADIQSLRDFQEAYVEEMHGFITALNANLNNPFPKLDLSEYKAKLVLLEKIIDANIRLIADKLKEPSTIIELEKVKPLCDEINGIIDAFNAMIKTNNDIVNDTTQKKACIDKVWELIAYTLQSDVSAFRSKRKAIDDEITKLDKIIADGETALLDIDAKITVLSKNATTTLATIKRINKLLTDSGFQGFRLREKRGLKNVYEVIRDNDEVAKKLSEGERNFIAFLYFYCLVQGGHEDTEVNRDKIVVIDDPVSSMDSSTLFIVSALVREMVGICFNNVEYREQEREFIGDYIKQIFVLTHNVYFHREITYNHARRYHCVSFYVVNKASNNSVVRHCIRRSQSEPSKMENFNPVQNSYAALWGEYREVDTVIPTMNVIRRILEYYFMQLCGYDGFDIRKRVLEDNRERFVMPVEKGQPDFTKYHLASAMLSYINANTVAISDGLNYVDDCADAMLYKDVFKLIFEALEQEQHYNMMMGEEV